MSSNQDKKQLKTLGEKISTFQGLDTFPTPPGCENIVCRSDEVTAVCPVTGQPDWYDVIIDYDPDEVCVESKALKLYLQKFRNEGHFCEEFSRIIARDLFLGLGPKKISVTVIQKPRGGIAIEATSVFRKRVTS